MVKKFWLTIYMFIRFDNIHERDRRTDGQTSHDGRRHRPHSIARQNYKRLSKFVKVTAKNTVSLFFPDTVYRVRLKNVHRQKLQFPRTRSIFYCEILYDYSQPVANHHRGRSTSEWVSILKGCLHYWCTFLPRDTSAALAVMRCPSVCVCVCLSRSYILSKRINVSSNFFHHRIATPF